MKRILVLVALIIVFVVIVPFIQVYVVRLLAYFDSKKDYSKYKFRIRKQEGYFTIDYLIWEENKLDEIKSRFSDEIVYEDTTYFVESIEDNNTIPGKLYFNQFVKINIKNQELE